VRRVVRLEKPKLDAWVYIYNQDVVGSRIESGDWRAHTENQAGRETAPSD
jgi:gamma-glutamylcyclotransferase (GGCT)/AIG2-like uncharacterized protein YtfP